MDFIEAIDIWTAGGLIYQLITQFRTKQLATFQHTVPVYILYESFVSRYGNAYFQLSMALRVATNAFSF